MSGFSLNGVYRAPIGTTNREASYSWCKSNGVMIMLNLLTMRELGNTFQLRRTPSLSSISPHCSFNAS